MIRMTDSIFRSTETTGDHVSRTEVAHPYNLRHALERFERKYLHNILELARRDRARAAEMLGISPGTLEVKLKKYETVNREQAAGTRHSQPVIPSEVEGRHPQPITQRKTAP